MGTAVAYALLIPVVYLLLPKMPPPRDATRKLNDFDLLGTVLMVGGVVSLLTSLQLLARGLSSGLLPIALGVTGVSALAAFVWVELHARAPILQFSPFKTPGVSLAASQAVVMGFASSSFLLLLPFYFITGIGWTAGYASQLLLFQNLMRPPTAPIAGRMADRWGSMAVIVPAAILCIAGQVVMSLLGVSPVAGVLIVVLTVWGAGQGLMLTANLRQIYASLPRHSLHLAPSINITFSQLGSTSGQAFGSLAVERAQMAGAGSAFVAYLGNSMLVVTAIFAVGMVLTQLLPRLLLRSRIAAGHAIAAGAIAAGQRDEDRQSDP